MRKDTETEKGRETERDEERGREREFKRERESGGVDQRSDFETDRERGDGEAEGEGTGEKRQSRLSEETGGQRCCIRNSCSVIC
jgi:hypothetical protein